MKSQNIKRITKLKNIIIRSFADSFSITARVISGLDILLVLV